MDKDGKELKYKQRKAQREAKRKRAIGLIAKGREILRAACIADKDKLQEQFARGASSFLMGLSDALLIDEERDDLVPDLKLDE